MNSTLGGTAVLAAFSSAARRADNVYTEIDDVVVDGDDDDRVLRFEFDDETRRVPVVHAGFSDWGMPPEGCA